MDWCRKTDMIMKLNSKMGRKKNQKVEQGKKNFLSSKERETNK